MTTRVSVDCDRKHISITQFLVAEGFTDAELAALKAVYQKAFNGAEAGQFRFRYGRCTVEFKLEIRTAGGRQKKGESRLIKVAPEPEGGGVTMGPREGAADKVVGVAPKPDGSFDWDTGIDELGHDLGITDPTGRTWFWRGRGGSGQVSADHVQQIFRNGLPKWREDARCCAEAEPEINRLSDDQLREAAAAAQPPAQPPAEGGTPPGGEFMAPGDAADLLRNWQTASAKEREPVLNWMRRAIGVRWGEPLKLERSALGHLAIVLPRGRSVLAFGLPLSRLPLPFAAFTLTDLDWRDARLTAREDGRQGGLTRVHYRVGSAVRHDAERGCFKVDIQFDLQFRILLDRACIDEMRRQRQQVIDDAIDAERATAQALGEPYTPQMEGESRARLEADFPAGDLDPARLYAHERAHVKAVRDAVAADEMLKRLIEEAERICEKTEAEARAKADDIRKRFAERLWSVIGGGLGHDNDPATPVPPAGAGLDPDPSAPMPPEGVKDDAWREDERKLKDGGYRAWPE